MKVSCEVFLHPVSVEYLQGTVSKSYNYVGFQWWQGVDLKKASEELSTEFSVEPIELPQAGISIVRDERDELKVHLDTLGAIFSRFRAVLFQKESAPFTERDVRLRKRILELYPRNRPTPFPWEYSAEPKFEVEK